jgi:hypothetical protein
MDRQPQQQFCTNCGQPLSPGTAFCASCGTPVMSLNVPPADSAGQFPAGAQPGSPSAYQSSQPYTPYQQVPGPDQGQDDPLLAALAAGALANRMNIQQTPAARTRRRGVGLRGCGCLLLVLVLLAGPIVGVVLTTGRLHMIFLYIVVGMVALFLLLALVGMLATKSGREALAEGLGEGCLDAIFGGLLGGG